jgi:endonuclease/exonuclease/phosphatase family metal-dependent hydrolase
MNLAPAQAQPLVQAPPVVATSEIAELLEATIKTPPAQAQAQAPPPPPPPVVVATSEIAELLEATIKTPPQAPPPPVVVATSEIAELLEATIKTPQAQTQAPPQAPPPPVVATSEIAELLEATIKTPPQAQTQAQAPQQPIQTQVQTQQQPTTTLNKANNKAGPYTPIDLDALIATIPPALVVPATPPPSIPTTNLIDYVKNIEFCYRFLYFVRNNKNNQTEQLNTIAKIIMEYYAPNDTTYFNFELKKIDLTKVLIDNIIIITNKGKQKLSDVLIDVPKVAPVAVQVAQVAVQAPAPRNTKTPESTKIVNETNAFRESQIKSQIKSFESMYIKILTYNINHASTGQARNNIMSILKKGGYDIIGIQESYDENLQISEDYDKVTSNVRKKGKNNVSFNATIITFYKKKRFEIKDVIYYGNCSKTRKDVARPYHIIKLLDKITQKNIDIINLHNEHENAPFKLTDTLKNGKSQDSNDHITNIDSTDKQIKHNNYTNNNNIVVVMGDFNTDYYFKEGILNTQKGSGDPPKSCCTGNYTRGGDYILTNGFKESKNTISDTMSGASDHYPVERILTYVSNYDENSPSIDYHIHYINSLPSSERETIINNIINLKKITDVQDINKLLDECLIESTPSKPSNTNNIYHEKQVSALCGIHALNNALQKQVFFKGDATANNTIAFIDAIKKDKRVAEKETELKNQNYLASTIVEAIKLVADKNEFCEMTPSLIQATYDENEILQKTIPDGTGVKDEVLLTGDGAKKNLRDFRIVFNKRKFHYTSAFFKEKEWIYLDSMDKVHQKFYTFNKLVSGIFKINPNSNVDTYISNLPWMCAFIPDSKYDGTTTIKKGGSVKHCQKTIKNRKTKSKGVTIKVH